MDPEDKIRIQEVIQFLIDNEQYGDNWKEHITILQKVRDEIEEEKKAEQSEQQEVWDQQTRVEEGLDHKGGEDDELKHSISGIEGGHQFIPDSEKKDEEPEIPENGWECSECGAPVEKMNDYCSYKCFETGMR